MKYKVTHSVLTVFAILCCSALSFAEDIRFQLLNGGSVVVDVADGVDVTVREQGVDRVYTGRIQGLKTKAGKPDGQYFMLVGDFGRKLIMIRDVSGIAPSKTTAVSPSKDPRLSERSPALASWVMRWMPRRSRSSCTSRLKVAWVRNFGTKKLNESENWRMNCPLAAMRSSSSKLIPTVVLWPNLCKSMTGFVTSNPVGTE